MPARRRTRKNPRSSRRSVRSRRRPRGRRRRGRVMRIQRGPFMRNRIVKMRYLQHLNLTPVGGTPIQQFVFVANSAYDPQYSLGGHQPMGFDQWSQFYNHWTVIGSKISIMSTIPSTGTQPGIFGVRTANESNFLSTYTDLEGIMEDPRCSWRLIQTAVNGNVPKPAVATYSAKKWWNLQSIKDNQDWLGGTVMSDLASTSQVYFVVFAGSLDSTTIVPSFQMICKLTYIVMFSDPKDLPQS